MADLYLVFLFVGLFFTAVSAILAGVFGGNTPGVSVWSSLVIAAAVTAFGGVGYLALALPDAGLTASLVAGLSAGIAAGALTRVVANRLFSHPVGQRTSRAMTEGSETSLLDEVLIANRERVAGRLVPRPPSLGNRRLLVLTCADTRLTALLPRAMGVGPHEMHQVRNAGVQVPGPEGDPVRSLAALILLGQATEVFVVGHTDCAMNRATTADLLGAMDREGVDPATLGGRDAGEWFGAHESVRENILNGARIIRSSAVLPAGVPVHALIVNTATGELELLKRG